MADNAGNARRIAALAIVLGVLAGCAVSERSETVFMQQNRTATALAEIIMEAEAKSSHRVDRLYQVENSLIEACAPLNRAAGRKMIGKPVQLDVQLAVAGSLDRCEAEAARVERLVRRLSPDLARLYIDQHKNPMNGVELVR